MSVRENEQRKNNCPSRGLGLAAAAIGVGVGAALYYFFSKRPENPDGEGSTSEGWSCEQPQAFDESIYEDSEYTTVSEHSTTDTSMYDDSNQETTECCDSSESTINADDSEFDITNMTSDISNSVDESVMSISSEEDTDSYDSNSDGQSESDYSDIDETNSSSNTYETGYITLRSQSRSDNISTVSINSTLNSINSLTPRRNSRGDTVNHSTVNSDSDTAAEWDITNSSYGVPLVENIPVSPMQRFFDRIGTFINPPSVTPTRERSWSLEECSICFEVMLRDQELLKLPCTHNFHVACIGPWLQEQQTCPMCRKAAE